MLHVNVGIYYICSMYTISFETDNATCFTSTSVGREHKKQEEHVDERRRQTDRERSNQAAKCKATQKQSLRTINEEKRFH